MIADYNDKLISLAIDLFVRGGKDFHDSIDSMGADDVSPVATSSVRQRAVDCIEAARIFYQEAEEQKII